MSEPKGIPAGDELIDLIARSRIATIETSAPGKVVSFDDTSDPPRCDIDLAVKFLRLDEDRVKVVSYTPPRLRDVPVMYPGGNGASLYWPLAAGDEVTVIFASRDTDNAVETGNAGSEPASPRRHHLMDAFVVPQTWSKQGLASGDRGTSLVIEPPAGDFIRLGKDATEFATNAKKVLNRLNALEIAFNAHEHQSVQPGIGTSGVPTVPTQVSLTSSSQLVVDKVKIE